MTNDNLVIILCMYIILFITLLSVSRDKVQIVTSMFCDIIPSMTGTVSLLQCRSFLSKIEDSNILSTQSYLRYIFSWYTRSVCLCPCVWARPCAHLKWTNSLFVPVLYIFTSRKLTDGPDDALSYSRSLHLDSYVGSVLRTVVRLVFAEVWDHIVYSVIVVSVKGTKKQVS